MDPVELRLSPQAGVDAVDRLVLLQEIVGLHTPGRAWTRAGHQRIGRGADETTHGIIEILPVGKRQRLRKLGVRLQRHGLRGLGRHLPMRQGAPDAEGDGSDNSDNTALRPH